LPSKVQDADTVILYYVGHGVVEDTQGGAYIAPYDAEPRIFTRPRFRSIRFRSFCNDALPPDRLSLLQTPSCGASWSWAEDRGVGNNQINMAIGRLATDRTGVYTITANRPSEPSIASADYGGGHGVFTHYLLQH